MLTYHAIGDPDFMPHWLFVDPQDFDRHLAYLKAHYTSVSLHEVLGRLRSGAPLPANGIAVTIDDGYRNAHSHAVPLLFRHGLWATVFACTRPADTGASLWVTRVFYWCSITQADTLWIGPGSQLPEVRTRLPEETALPLRTRAERQRAAFWVVSAMRRPGTREDLLDRVAAALGVSQHADPSALLPMLSWGEIEDLDRQGIEIGGHTVSHWSLPSLSRRAAWEETVKCKAALESHLGKTVPVFAYPFGDRDAAVERLVREAGYMGALTMADGTQRGFTCPYGLHRKSLGNWPVELLALELAGL